MADESSGERGGFRVEDKRRFDSSGKERPHAEAEEKREEPARSEEFVMKDAKPEEPQPGELEINFSSFVLSLATQALMQLGQVTPPEGVDVPVDRRAARQTIDIIGMLQEKTKGNLTQDEAQLIEEILHNLRIGFVRAA